MRILLSADLHETDTFSRHVRESQSRSIQELITIYRQRACAKLVFAGDIIHDKSLVYIDSLRRLEDLIIRNPDVNFEFVIGNHDYVGAPSNHCFSSFQRAYPNVRIIDRVQYDTLPDGRILTYLPHSPTIADELLEIPGSILISHFGVNDAEVIPGISVHHRISMTMLSRFEWVFLGHYHYPQKLTSKTTQLYYIGSSSSQSWSDKNQTKRSLLFDTEENTVESIPFATDLQFIEVTVSSQEQLQESLRQKKLAEDAGNLFRIRSSVALDGIEIEDTTGIILELADELPAETQLEQVPELLLQNWLERHQEELTGFSLSDVLREGIQILQNARESLEDDEVDANASEF